MNSNNVYMFIIVFLILIESVFAIPVVLEFIILDNDIELFATLPIILGAVHIVLYLCSFLNFFDNPMKYEHVLGFFAAILNMIPFINFIPHLILVIMMFRYLREELTERRNRIKEFKANGGVVDTTFRFSEKYTSEADKLYEDAKKRENM